MMNIYIGNLSYETDDTELHDAFAGFGEVVSATVIRDKFSGRSRGFGFVEMADRAEAQAAIEALNGSELRGRTLNVNEARPKTERDQQGGGNRGRGRGGRRN